MAESILRQARHVDDRVAAHLSIGGKDIGLHLGCTTHELSASADAYVVAALLPAMREGAPLVVEGGVSPRLLDSLPDAQAIISSWIPSLREIEVRAEPTSAAAQKPAGIGAFFSLGVDSFYTLQRNKDRLTHLVIVKGYDAASLGDDLWKRIVDNARRVAALTEIELVEVDTNLRRLVDLGIGWRWLHGPALASVGHALGELLGTMYISASQTTVPLGPWGSHPALDPLWSSERVEFVHFGPQSRVRKMISIQDDPLVLDTLRVCLARHGHAYNCGRCEKCVCMMVTLQATGRLAKSATFPDRIDPRSIRKLDIARGSRAKYFAEALHLLRDRNGDPQLIRALERKLRRARLSLAVGGLRDLLGRRS